MDIGYVETILAVLFLTFVVAVIVGVRWVIRRR
jgi:hypothetical protein